MTEIATLMAKHARPSGHLTSTELHDLVWSQAGNRAVRIRYGSCPCGHGLTDTEWLNRLLGRAEVFE